MVYPFEVGGHIDAALSNLAVTAFDTGEEGFVADQLFPSVPVGKQSDRYYIISRGAFLRVHSTERAPSTKAKKIEFEVSSNGYFCINHALSNETSIEHLSNADLAIQYRENAVRLVTSGLRRAQEVRIANAITSISNVGSGVSLTGGAKWSDFVNSDPMADVTTAHAFIRQTTGLRPNVCVLDEDTFAVVRRHPLLLDMYKYTSGGELSEDQIRSLFRVRRLLIAGGIKENMPEGSTSSSMTNIWGNNAVFAVINPPSGLQTVTLGLRMQWRPENAPAPFITERRLNIGAGTEKTEIVEVGHYQDEKVIASELGYTIAATL